MAILERELVGLYVANYNRAPDSAGMQYWIGVGATGVTLDTIGNSFLDIHENGVDLRALSNEDFAVRMVLHLYGRTILNTDTEAVNLAALLTAGTYTRASLIQYMISSATGNDLLTINNKVTVCTAYVNAGFNGTTYYLTAITFDYATVVTAIDGFITNTTNEPVVSTSPLVSLNCSITLPESAVTTPVGTLDVTGKFQQLTDAALALDSVYMRAKDTFLELMNTKKINETEYAQLASSFVSQLAVSTTQYAMQTAMQWAVAERDGVLTQESLKAQAELTMAQREKTRMEICKIQKDTELQCAQIKAVVAGSIRDNGRILEYGPDGCTPVTLVDEGIKFIQAKTLQSQMYSTLADAYRKSGVVQIGNGTDGYVKAISGDAAGYTHSQDLFAQRQTKSFEDSKRSHAANASAQMIGQLLAQEVVPTSEYVAQFNAAMTYLNTNTP